MPYYQRLLASQPARRLNPKQLLEAGVLRNRLAEATSFLENLAIKDTMEKVGPLECLLLRAAAAMVPGWLQAKLPGSLLLSSSWFELQDTFFKRLPSLLPSIPPLVAQRKLLPMLASAIEFGGAPPVRPTTLLPSHTHSSVHLSVVQCVCHSCPRLLLQRCWRLARRCQRKTTPNRSAYRRE